MTAPSELPRYDPRQTYDWNYEHAPEPVDVAVPQVTGRWQFCGRPIASPLGVAAGPLLNGRWLRYYAALGFEVLTYKTVRSIARPCYPLPNLQPVECGQLAGGENALPTCATMQGSWAVSFGMPSQPPDVWRADIQRARQALPSGKVLSVSVVGTDRPGFAIEDLADDYAQCAGWAVESGADVIETNFSCPNVSTCDGQLYQNPRDAALVASKVRAAIGRVPLAIKVGYLQRDEDGFALIEAISPIADALVMTNSVATRVHDKQDRELFGGELRGICGAGIREASLAQVARFRRLIERSGAELELVGVGGIATAEDVRRYLVAGAGSVQIATACMVDPLVACRIREGLASPMQTA